MSLHKYVYPNIPVFREKSARFVAAKVSAAPEARVSFSRKRDIRRMWSPMAYCVVLSFNRLVCSTSIQRCTRSSVKEIPANKCHPSALKLIMIYVKSICTDTCIYTRIKMHVSEKFRNCRKNSDEIHEQLFDKLRTRGWSIQIQD